jgi:5-hydroxyisourate hydrolase
MSRWYRISLNLHAPACLHKDYRKGSANIPPKIFESLFVALCFTGTYAWHLIGAQLIVRVRMQGGTMSKTDGGRLTTHVLDTASGKPAAGLSIALYRVSGNSHRKLKTVVTNSDGRCDEPLLQGKAFQPGQYELIFSAGDYFRAFGMDLPDPMFLDQVPIRFGMSEDKHYHVPLLISPYGYSTYRGS